MGFNIFNYKLENLIWVTTKAAWSSVHIVKHSWILLGTYSGFLEKFFNILLKK